MAYPLKDIPQPHQHDVLCGRGGGTNNYLGNSNWRTLVASNKELYVTLPRKKKMLLSKSIVNAVRSQNPPGRFLQKHSGTDMYYDIGDQKAQEKTSQALREATAPTSSSSPCPATMQTPLNGNVSGVNPPMKPPVKPPLSPPSMHPMGMPNVNPMQLPMGMLNAQGYPHAQIPQQLPVMKCTGADTYTSEPYQTEDGYRQIMVVSKHGVTRVILAPPMPAPILAQGPVPQRKPYPPRKPKRSLPPV
jgi:hypothetical protein